MMYATPTGKWGIFAPNGYLYKWFSTRREAREWCEQLRYVLWKARVGRIGR